MKPNGQDEKPPLNRALGYRRGLKFLRALQEGGDEAFNRAWDEAFPPESESDQSPRSEEKRLSPKTPNG